MAIKLNSAGKSNANSLIEKGDYDVTSSWSFSADDGNKLLGNGDWSHYAKFFLAFDSDATKETKDYYKYPFGKNDKVYRSGLIAIRQRAGQQKETDIYDAAGTLVEAIDKKEGAEKLFGHYDSKGGIIPIFTKLKNGRWELKSVKPTTIIKDVDEDGVITSLISTSTPDRAGDIMLPSGVNLKNFYSNPLVLWMHNDSTPPIGRNVGIQTTSTGLIAKTFFNQATQLSKDIYTLYKNGDMFAFSVGFIPTEWDDDQESGNRTYKKWELLEYSCVTIPMNPEALTLSMHPDEDAARAVIRAVQKGLIASDSETLKFFGVDTAIKTVEPAHEEETVLNQIKELLQKYSTMETKKLSTEDTAEVVKHGKSLAKGIMGCKDALSHHSKGIGLHKSAIDFHEKAIEKHKDALDGQPDDTIKAMHEEALAMHKSALGMHKDALYSHEKAFGLHKDALETMQKAFKGIKSFVDKGYPGAWGINDDSDAATEPFKDEEPTKGGESGNVANVVNMPKGFAAEVAKEIVKMTTPSKEKTKEELAKEAAEKAEKLGLKF